MKRLIVVELILLLIFFVFSRVPEVSKATTDLLTAYPVPEEIRGAEPYRQYLRTLPKVT